jgi:hypothetical protein
VAQFQVMTYRAQVAATGAAKSEVVVLPDGWQPLSAHTQGEFVVVLCCQEVLPPPPER